MKAYLQNLLMGICFSGSLAAQAMNASKTFKVGIYASQNGFIEANAALADVVEGKSTVYLESPVISENGERVSSIIIADEAQAKTLKSMVELLEHGHNFVLRLNIPNSPYGSWESRETPTHAAPKQIATFYKLRGILLDLGANGNHSFRVAFSEVLTPGGDDEAFDSTSSLTLSLAELAKTPSSIEVFDSDDERVQTALTLRYAAMAESARREGVALNKMLREAGFRGFGPPTKLLCEGRSR